MYETRIETAFIYVIWNLDLGSLKLYKRLGFKKVNQPGLGHGVLLWYDDMLSMIDEDAIGAIDSHSLAREATETLP